jgi:hypothetical protein
MLAQLRDLYLLLRLCLSTWLPPPTRPAAASPTLARLGLHVHTSLLAASPLFFLSFRVVDACTYEPDHTVLRNNETYMTLSCHGGKKNLVSCTRRNALAKLS